MLSGIARLFLMVSSIAPIGLTYAWVAGAEEEYQTAGIIIGTCSVLVIGTVLFIRHAKKTLASVEFTPTSIEVADSENIAFMLLYLLPLFENGFNGLNWTMTIPAILIFSLVIWTGYGYHFNPLLGLLGWHFYKVGTYEGVTYVLISRKELRAAHQIMEVGQLTEFIVLDKGEDD
jgi:hypothetical protein